MTMKTDFIMSRILLLREFCKNKEMDMVLDPYTDCLFRQPVAGGITDDSEELIGSALKERIAALHEDEVLQIAFGGDRNG